MPGSRSAALRSSSRAALLRVFGAAACLLTAGAHVARAQSEDGLEPRRWTSHRLATVPPGLSNTGGSVLHIAISRDGEEAAYPATDGERFVVMRGDARGDAFTATFGPVFTRGREILAYRANVGGTFSPNHSRLDGGSWYVVVNGHTSEAYDAVGELRVTPDGLRIVYRAKTAAGLRAYFVDQAGTHYTEAYDALGEPVFTPDGAHWAANASRGGTKLVVLDDRPRYAGECDVSAPSLSPDGRTVAFARRCGEAWSVVVNGEDGPQYAEVTAPAISARGSVAYGAAQGRDWHLVVDGVEQARTYPKITRVVFSPDGAHLALVVWPSADHPAIVLDGRQGPPLTSATNPRFDARGRLMYASEEGDGHRVHAGATSATTDLTPYELGLSPDGRTLAIVGGKDDAVFVAIGEKRYGPYRWAGAPAFSADGARAAFPVLLDGELWLRVVPVRGDDVETHRCRGASLALQGDWSAAITEYSRGLALDARNAELLQLRGVARARASDLQGAIRDTTAATVLDPGGVGAWVGLTRLESEAGNAEGAIAAADRGLAANPGSEALLSERAARRYAAEQFAGAVQDATAALRLWPKDVDALRVRAMAKMKLGDGRGAIADSDRAIELAPENGTLYYNRGAFRLVLGETAAACSDLSRAGELGEADAYELMKDSCERR